MEGKQGSTNPGAKPGEIREVFPKSGLLYSERGNLTEGFTLCKPKILPLKSVVLEQLQKIEQAADDEDEKARENRGGGIYRDG